MIALSSEVAPQLSLADLAVACRARGFDGEEVVLAPGDAMSAAQGGRVLALRTAHVDEASAPALAHAAAALGAPVSVPAGAYDPQRLAGVVEAFARAGGRLLLGCRSDLDEALGLVLAIRAICAPAALGVAWEVEPAHGDLAEASAILLATRELLGVVRLHGGGPEQRDQDGRGIGALTTELALTGFAGPIVLCPSSPGMVARWTAWLAARGSSGCGHAVSQRGIDLDVRELEPRHRLDAILGAYRQLVPGATLYLTVDHDPVCMYYTLEATEPEHSFAFAIVTHGPEVWRAEVTKR